MSDNRNIVEPSILSGFMELLPREQMKLSKMMSIITKSYESYGFIPLDTPVIEKSEILLAKSGGDTEKQIYRFTKGDSDMALRFDMTVPLARFVAQHYGELTFPFRRYAIGKVYRGEKPQKGRFREFYQCDIDIIGNGSLAVINDAEIVSIIYSTFKALDIGSFTIMINNRKILAGLCEYLNVEDPVVVLRIIDKIDKIGGEKVVAELETCGFTKEQATLMMNVIALNGGVDEVVGGLAEFSIDNELFNTGVAELKAVCDGIKSLGIPEDVIKIALKIARGLDYYTGTVYETQLDDYPQLGSICSGGRYDNLASNYTKQSLPGVGISIGLSRLFYQLNASGILDKSPVYNIGATPTQILFIPMADTMQYTLSVAAKYRQQGYNVEVYMNDGKLGKKMGYADKLGIPYVAVIGSDEMESGVINFKNMKTGETTQNPVF